MKEAFLLRFEPKRYLDSQGNLRLPESMRAYVGPSGYEMDQLDDEQRMDDKVTCRVRVDRPFSYINQEEKPQIFEFLNTTGQKMMDIFQKAGSKLNLR